MKQLPCAYLSVTCGWVSITLTASFIWLYTHEANQTSIQTEGLHKSDDIKANFYQQLSTDMPHCPAQTMMSHPGMSRVKGYDYKNMNGKLEEWETMFAQKQQN